MAKRKRRAANDKPPTPKLETALFWATVAKLAAKQVDRTRVALKLGEYKVHATIRGEVILGARRKARAVEAVLSADVDVDPSTVPPAAPREKPLLAGLLATVSRRTAAEIIRALPQIQFDKLTDEQLAEAKELLDSIKQQRPRKKTTKVSVSGRVDEVTS